MAEQRNGNGMMETGHNRWFVSNVLLTSRYGAVPVDVSGLIVYSFVSLFSLG